MVHGVLLPMLVVVVLLLSASSSSTGGADLEPGHGDALPPSYSGPGSGGGGGGGGGGVQQSDILQEAYNE